MQYRYTLIFVGASSPIPKITYEWNKRQSKGKHLHYNWFAPWTKRSVWCERENITQTSLIRWRSLGNSSGVIGIRLSIIHASSVQFWCFVYTCNSGFNFGCLSFSVLANYIPADRRELFDILPLYYAFNPSKHSFVRLNFVWALTNVFFFGFRIKLLGIKNV